ncbi:MAG: hypothetical protein LC721_04585, partial [Actinobacteria bacterium]|nr:hypothetical protein [Actinomycetota bacterium]
PLGFADRHLTGSSSLLSYSYAILHGRYPAARTTVMCGHPVIAARDESLIVSRSGRSRPVV